MTKIKNISLILCFKILLISLNSFAFVILDRNYALSNSEAVVNIASDSCPNVGVSNEVLKQAIQIAIDDFWNTVSESTLRLKLGDVVTRTTFDELQEGEILVGCSATAPGNGGVASNNPEKGSALVMLDSQINAAGFDRIVGVVVHEIGHGVGLTHSADPSSVMTYAQNGWGLRPKYLSQDDKNGVMYLYPLEGKLLGLMPGCSANAKEYRDSKIFSQKKSLIAFFQEILFFLIVFLIARKFIFFLQVRRR